MTHLKSMIKTIDVEYEKNEPTTATTTELKKHKCDTLKASRNDAIEQILSKYCKNNNKDIYAYEVGSSTNILFAFHTVLEAFFYENVSLFQLSRQIANLFRSYYRRNKQEFLTSFPIHNNFKKCEEFRGEDEDEFYKELIVYQRHLLEFLIYGKSDDTINQMLPYLLAFSFNKIINIYQIDKNNNIQSTKYEITDDHISSCDTMQSNICFNDLEIHIVEKINKNDMNINDYYFLSSMICDVEKYRNLISLTWMDYYYAITPIYADKSFHKSYKILIDNFNHGMYT